MSDALFDWVHFAYKPLHESLCNRYATPPRIAITLNRNTARKHAGASSCFPAAGFTGALQFLPGKIPAARHHCDFYNADQWKNRYTITSTKNGTPSSQAKTYLPMIFSSKYCNRPLTKRAARHAVREKSAIGMPSAASEGAKKN
ncbi:MAG TPA: hypothetical protein VHB46_20230 [Burkholderiales bacterium]|nr:hypothetical protein [Burkholderiales bacterium]